MVPFCKTNDYVVAGGMDARVSVYSRNFITSGVMQSNENDNDGPISEGYGCLRVVEKNTS